MSAYLTHGWLTSSGTTRLREEVLAGTLDQAAHLRHSGTSHRAVRKLAERVDALCHTLAQRMGEQSLSQPLELMAHEAVVENLTLATDDNIALQSLIWDFLDHITQTKELAAMGLHLDHIAEVMRLMGRVDSQASLASSTLQAFALTDLGRLPHLGGHRGPLNHLGR